MTSVMTAASNVRSGKDSAVALPAWKQGIAARAGEGQLRLGWIVSQAHTVQPIAR